MIPFKSKRKKILDELKIKSNGKGIYPTTTVNYLGAKMDENLAFQLVTKTS